MTEFEEHDIKLKFEGTLMVKVPKGVPEPFDLAKSIAMDRVLAKVDPTGGSDEGFQSWCDAIDMNMSEEECEEKYGDIYDTAITEQEYADGIWEWDGF